MRFFEAELHRLRGEILLTMGRRGEAEAGLRRALTIAQQQQARWWELRAATTLAKHWQDEGKYLEAYSLLQPVCGWFVEGFDTTPLKDAKALLGELRDLLGPQTQARRGWVAPILIFNVPKGCSAVSRRWRMACGFLSRRFCTASKMCSCSQRATRRCLPVVQRCLIAQL